jgi:hypothetical protein
VKGTDAEPPLAHEGQGRRHDECRRERDYEAAVTPKVSSQSCTTGMSMRWNPSM